MNATIETLDEITNDAIDVLCREMGVVRTLRFLGQFSKGYGNYTEEREHLFKDLTVADVIAEVKRNRNKAEK